MTQLTLGAVTLESFEVPSSIRFGGEQRCAVHRLLGGGRVIDAMGRDDAALTWSGVISGAEASARARLLDAMRVAGGVLVLSWDAFCYDVVVGRLELEFCSPWWITYAIKCLVVSDLAQGSVPYVPDAQDSIAADLAAASAGVASGSLLIPAPGVATSLPPLSAVGGLLSSFGAQIATAEGGLDAADLPDIVSAAGQLAAVTAARGFVGRAFANLAEAVA